MKRIGLNRRGQRLLNSMTLTLKRVRLPGGRGATAHDVMQMLSQGLQGNGFSFRAYAVAFNLFLAFFPFLLLLFLLFPYLPIDGLFQRVREAVLTVVPHDAQPVVVNLLTKLFEKQGAGFISFTALACVFFARRGVRTLLKAMTRRNDEHFRRLKWWQAEVRGLSTLALMLLFVLGSFASYGLLEWAWAHALSLAHLEAERWRWLWYVLEALIQMSILAVGVSGLLHWAPAQVQRPGWINPGGVLAGLVMYLAFLALEVYFQYFGQYNELFGSLGAVVVLLLWFYWLSVVVLLGFEFNTGLMKARSAAVDRENFLKE